MPARTIPEPTDTDRFVAATGLQFQAVARGVDQSAPGVESLMRHMVEVIAQQDAEIRWLRNMIHK